MKLNYLFQKNEFLTIELKIQVTDIDQLLNQFFASTQINLKIANANYLNKILSRQINKKINSYHLTSRSHEPVRLTKIIKKTTICSEDINRLF